jgi:two-component system NtrC family sensor kinase
VNGSPVADDRPRVLVVEGDDLLRATLIEDLTQLIGGSVEIVAVASGEAGLAAATQIVAAGNSIPVAFIERTLPGMSGAELALAMHADQRLARTRRVLVTQATSLSNVDAALSRGAVQGMLTRPWSIFALTEQLRAQLSTYHVEHDPGRLELYGDLIQADDRSMAQLRIDQRRAAPRRSLDEPGHVLLTPHMDDAEVVSRLVAALDQALGHPPRLRVSPGSILLEQGADVGGIYVILDGEVELRRRTEAGEGTVHREGTGPIVGLLSLASQRRAFLEVRAVTEVRALPVTLGQLEQAIAAESDVGPLLTRTLVNALANRLRDADDLQIRIDALNARVEQERDQLADALDALERAQATLVQQARMATLGELAAGIAHELNNPVAALTRAAEFVATDVDALLAGDQVAQQLDRARHAQPMPSTELRAARQLITDRLGDRSLAERLVTAGVTDPDQAVALAASPAQIERIAAAHQLGNELRNITTASARVADLVSSLRSYLRGGEDSPPVADIDITETVDDALRLLGHRLADVTIERQYEPVPHGWVRPGQLQQLWTNLVANALDAAGPSAHLLVQVDAPDATHVRVRITDDGPGIDPAIAEQLYTPHFTTKHGRVSFGIGLGLSVCRQIVEAHGGTIELRSAAGLTVATVVLPIGATVPDGEDSP